MIEGSSWSYGSWTYYYLCNQCLSPLLLWVRIRLRLGVLDTTLCYKTCQWLAAGRWFSPGTPVSPTNKTDRHDIAEILLNMSLNTITLAPNPYNWMMLWCRDTSGCVSKIRLAVFNDNISDNPASTRVRGCQKINYTLLDASVKMPEDISYPPGYIC